MEIKKISEFEFEVGENGKVFASEELMKNISGDRSMQQVENVGKLQGIIGKSLAMPDMHQGYGFPIGGVAAFDLDKGIVSPGGVGYDINCSVRLLATNLVEADLEGKEKEIVHSLARAVPTGVGSRNSVVGSRSGLSDKELDEVLSEGAGWAVRKGYGFLEDLEFIEDKGKLEGDPAAVSGKAKGRGRRQLGTLGAGNHFLDVLVVDEVFDEKVAKVFGLEKGQVVILIHCGSRGLGHQVASDYIQEMGKKCGFPEDRELVNAPFRSELGQKYFGAMNAAANFAFANKQVLTHLVRENLKHHFSGFEARVVYDICHNIAKVEEHEIGLSNFQLPESSDEDSSQPAPFANASRSISENSSKTGEVVKKKVLVMRKGATRSFGPGREEVPEKYRDVGQPVLLPGSMGTSSYVLVGTSEAMEKSFGSCSHGAGRVRSRSEAHREISFSEAKNRMEERGVFVEFGAKKGMIEEAPESYKDVDEVVRVCDSLGLGKKVARMEPRLVLIG